jgi:hypothetical protein
MTGVQLLLLLVLGSSRPPPHIKVQGMADQVRQEHSKADRVYKSQT